MCTGNLTRVAPALLAACFVAGCGSSATAAPQSLPMSGATVRLGLDSTCSSPLKTFSVQVAQTDDEKYAGLSGRRKPLSSHEGMLFEFIAPVNDSFYMRDTFIPLSIAFFDSDHRLIRSFEMPVETDPAHPAKLYAPNGAFVDAFEAAPGSFEGLNPGEVFLCIG